MAFSFCLRGDHLEGGRKKKEGVSRSSLFDFVVFICLFIVLCFLFSPQIDVFSVGNVPRCVGFRCSKTPVEKFIILSNI